MAEKSDVFCPTPLEPSAFVWAASMTVAPPLTREQTRHGSVRIQARYSGLLSGPRRGWNRILRTGTTVSEAGPAATAHSGVMAHVW